MLKEFYDFIAKRINRYFLELSAEGALQRGESFCLKLDDSETVQAVSNAYQGTTFDTISADTKAADKHKIGCAYPPLFLSHSIYCAFAP